MPLFLGDGRRSSIGGTIDSNRSFINKRIMLPFDLDICPLGMFLIDIPSILLLIPI